jgi:hypothetical protein
VPHLLCSVALIGRPEYFLLIADRSRDETAGGLGESLATDCEPVMVDDGDHESCQLQRGDVGTCEADRDAAEYLRLANPVYVGDPLASRHRQRTDPLFGQVAAQSHHAQPPSLCQLGRRRFMGSWPDDERYFIHTLANPQARVNLRTLKFF